jgi:hypothetical protein
MLSNYRMRVLAVDWGGGGKEGISFTTVALVCLRHDGRIDVPWAVRLLTPHDHIREAMQIKHFWDQLHPQFLAHDYTGAGSLRETFLIQSGVPIQHIFPAMYVRSASQTPCYHVGWTEQHPRDHYRVDKSRSLQMTCNMIRVAALRFFDADYEDKENPGILRDFLALVEDNVETAAAGEIYRITRQQGACDDFAQAVNIGCVCLWYTNSSWPDFADLVDTMLTQEQIQAAAPANPDWFEVTEADHRNAP